MHCPACRTAVLRPVQVDPLLPARQCERCGGHFIRGEQYYVWLNHPDRKTESHPPPDDLPLPSVDTTQAKLCPECGKLMTRHPVGHGLDFSIDRCATCGGIWLDAHEWEALRRRELHDSIHRVFSSAWQLQLLHQQQEQAARSRLMARIGQSDFDELERIAQWIDRHPHRDEIFAYLLAQKTAADARDRAEGA